MSDAPVVLIPTCSGWERDMGNWEIRYETFVFPPEEPTVIMTPDGPMRISRPLTEEEVLKKRKYLEIRAVLNPLMREGEEPHFAFRYFYSVLWELVGDVPTTPRLREWRENRAKTGATDLKHFREHFLPARPQEVEMLLEWVRENEPKGINIGG